MMTIRITKCKRLYGVELKPGDVLTVPTPIAHQLLGERHADHLLSKHWGPRCGEPPGKVYDFTDPALDPKTGAAKPAVR